MAKYSNLLDVKLSSTVDLPSKSNLTTVSNAAVDVSETTSKNTASSSNMDVNIQEIDTSKACYDNLDNNLLENDHTSKDDDDNDYKNESSGDDDYGDHYQDATVFFNSIMD
ncbi:hypothetical protein FQA39_LY18926 [Lamprigera yunnana]|nr:hypothetical protein FQA39_LY18926 [Lamprigera yunnana]